MSGPNSTKLGNNPRAIIGDSIIRLYFRRLKTRTSQMRQRGKYRPNSCLFALVVSRGGVDEQNVWVYFCCQTVMYGDPNSDKLLTAAAPQSVRLDFGWKKRTAAKQKAFDIRRGQRAVHSKEMRCWLNALRDLSQAIKCDILLIHQYTIHNSVGT